MDFERDPSGYAWCRIEQRVAGRAGLRESLRRVRDSGDARLVLLQIGERSAVAADDFEWLRHFPLPLICAFEGPLAGAAAGLALGCDVRVCGAAASLEPGSLDESGRALLSELLAGQGGSGDHRVLSSADLLDLGLVSEVAAAGGALDAGRRLAGLMASRGPIALELGKEATWRGLAMRFEQALRFETDLTLLLQTTKDRAEGVAAFIEKRPPRFTGT